MKIVDMTLRSSLHIESYIFVSPNSSWPSCIAVNDADKSIIIGEIKRNPDKIDIDTLKEKSVSLVAHHKKWTIAYIGLSMDDMLP